MKTQWKTLGEIAEINPPLRRGLDPEAEVAFVPMAGVSEDGHLVAASYRPAREVLKGYTSFEEGMENGKAAMASPLNQKIGFGSTEFHVLRAKDKTDPRFLFHAVWNSRFRKEAARNMTGSAGQKRVPKSFLERYQIACPLPAEQKRLAAILDQADAIRRKRQQALRLTDDFLRSVFLDFFGDPVNNPKGWETCPLSDLIANGDTVNYGVIQPGTDYPGGIPLVRAGDVASANPDVSKLKHIDPEIDGNYERSRLRGGEVLIGCVGAVGATCIAPKSWKGVNIARAVARIRLRPDIEAEFILALLRTEALQRYFTEEIRVVAQPTLNIKQIKETKIMLPPATLRKQFVALARKILETKENQVLAANEAENLFQSIQHGAFTGQL